MFNQKAWYEIMFGLMKKIFIGLLTIGGSWACNSIKYAFLDNQSCQTRPTLGDINSNESVYYHLLPVLISVVEVVILLMIIMLEYVFQIK